MNQNTGTLDSRLVDLRASLKAQSGDIEVATSFSKSHPDLVLVDPNRGLIAIDIHDSVEDDGRRQFIELNRRIDSLRADIYVDDDLPIARALAVDSGLPEPITGIAKRVLVPTSQLEDMRWVDLIDKEVLNHSTLQKVRSALFPTIVFTSTLRRGISDDGAEDRAARRVVLDQQQAHIAGRDVNNALVLTGPPGSGKTLVLAARARRLAAEHPDWRIQLLCYNKALIPYLRRLVSDAPNVRVSRMWDIASEFGVRFSYDDDEVTSAGLKAAERKGLAKPLDAVLIDEVQDFRIPWLEIAHSLVRPNRGGMLLAGDAAQALYHDSDLPTFLRRIEAEHVQLEVPYRSTRQILSAIRGLDPSFTVLGLDEAPEGPPVDLVWAQSWDEQAECVAFEVNHLLTQGGLEPRDIGILVTKYAGTYGRIQRALDQYEIPYSAMAARDKSEFDLFSNTVKLLTVHSAKGYEFKAVVLFGLETLPDPDQADPEAARRARVAFVGTTRAMDSLLITYTRDNKFLKMLSSDRDYVSRYCWPDDYEEVSGG
ncbi:AAA family ATPase [Rhodococcus hoagii]|nr:AAA family ATPase [Prescottella equi]